LAGAETSHSARCLPGGDMKTSEGRAVERDQQRAARDAIAPRSPLQPERDVLNGICRTVGNTCRARLGQRLPDALVQVVHREGVLLGRRHLHPVWTGYSGGGLRPDHPQGKDGNGRDEGVLKGLAATVADEVRWDGRGLRSRAATSNPARHPICVKQRGSARSWIPSRWLSDRGVARFWPRRLLVALGLRCSKRKGSPSSPLVPYSTGRFSSFRGGVRTRTPALRRPAEASVPAARRRPSRGRSVMGRCGGLRQAATDQHFHPWRRRRCPAHVGQGSRREQQRRLPIS